MRSEFTTSLKANQSAFGIELSEAGIGRLADYYELVQEHNPLLHLVGPCSPEEFAIRHILESLTLLKYLPQGARFADVGTGAGLPSIPCLLIREDLQALLIESKEKKMAFLQEVLVRCKLTDRVEMAGSQFSEVKPDVGYITCRALDKFSQKVPQLIKWAKNCTCLFFGGPTLRTALDEYKVGYNEYLLPMSDRRYIFVIKKK